MISASIFELIQSVLLIVVAIITIIISIGILRLDSDMDNVVYARIHILGVIDIASVIAFICLGDRLLGDLYFILAPFTAHAMAHGYFHGEDLKNNPYASDSEEFDMRLMNLFIRHGTGTKASYELCPVWRVQTAGKGDIDFCLAVYDAVSGKRLFEGLL